MLDGYNVSITCGSSALEGPTTCTLHSFKVSCPTQGIVGSVPWTALVFLTLYLQLLGMTDFAASVLMAVFLGSTGMYAHLQHSAAW